MAGRRLLYRFPSGPADGRPGQKLQHVEIRHVQVLLAQGQRDLRASGHDAWAPARIRFRAAA